jgi:ABC-type transport system substrate-binding protein
MVRWVRDSVIELARDSLRVAADGTPARIVWLIAGSSRAAADLVRAGTADVAAGLTASQVRLSPADSNVSAVFYPAWQYGAITFNLLERGGAARPHPILGDRGVRLAFSIATNRDSLVAAHAGETATPWPAGDSAQGSYDVQRAARMFDSLGWRLGADSLLRRKAGAMLQLSLLYPESSALRRGIAGGLATSMARLGVSIVQREVPLAEFGRAVAAGDYDMYFGTAALPASPDSTSLPMFQLQNAALVSTRVRSHTLQEPRWWRGLSRWTLGTATRRGGRS